jgi:hypothetical protein
MANVGDMYRLIQRRTVSRYQGRVIRLSRRRRRVPRSYNIRILFFFCNLTEKA